MNILTQYHADVASFPLAWARLGILKAGRYSGFDVIKAGSGGTGIPIKLYHSTKALRPTQADNTRMTYEGTVLTPHGVILKTTEEISLNIAYNIVGGDPDSMPSGSGERVDLIYLEYLWVADDVITDPFIAVKQGTRGAGYPTLDNPATQVALGYVYLPFGADSISEISYDYTQVPLLGDTPINDLAWQLNPYFARLNATNLFNGTQSVTPLGMTITPTLANTADNYQLLLGESNVFYLDFNYQTIAIGDIPQSQTHFVAGSRIIIYCYNVGTNSYFKKSTTGHHPGFNWSFQGPFYPQTYFPIKNGDSFELICEGANSWRITGYSDSLGYLMKVAMTDLTNLKTWVSVPSAWKNVPVSSGSESDRFNTGFSGIGGIEGEIPLRYRKSIMGGIEITGGFRYSGTANTLTRVFTLPSTHNPNRHIDLPVYIAEGGEVGAALYHTQVKAYISKSGAVYVYTYDDVITLYNINVNIPIMPFDGALPD